MRLRLCMLFLGLFYLMGSYELRSQNNLFPKYEVQSVALGEDVSSMEIKVVFQDRKGFIWIGTEAGLSKYDGIKFTNFDFIAGAKIATIYDIAEDEGGIIWAIGSNGLFYYDGLELRHALGQDHENIAMLIDQDQNLIIGGIDFVPISISKIQLDSIVGGHSVKPKKLFNNLQWQEIFETNVVWELDEDNKGNIWLGLENRLFRVENNNPVEVWRSDEPRMNISEIAAITPDSVYWGGELSSMYFRNKKGTINLPTSYTSSLHRADSSLFVLTFWNLLNLKSGEFQEIYDLKETRHLYYKDLIQDSEGNFWIATEGSLLKVTQQYFRGWSVEDSSILESNHSITQLQSGKIIVGSNKQRVLEFDGGKFRQRDNIPAARNSITEGVLEDEKGRIWFGTTMSGLILEDENKHQLFNSESGLLDNTLLFITQDEYGRIWAGGDNGVNEVLESGEEIRFRNYEPQGKVDNTPRFINVICLSEDQCWAFSKTGIYKLENDKLIPVEIHGIDDLPIITQVIKNQKGQLLVSTLGAGILSFQVVEGGEIHFREKWDKSLGLLSNNVLNLHEDKKARIWAFSQNGTCVIEKKGVNCYNLYDGWFPLETSHIDVLESKDSIMWVVANSGIISFPLYSIPENKVSPQVFITDVKLFEGKRDISTFLQAEEKDVEYKLLLPHDQNFLEFNFTTTSHTRKEKNTFVYQLEGLEEDWNLATHLTKANYPGLLPGRYVFKVKAINNSGLEGNSIAQYSFRIKYPWYARWWAILGYLLLASSLVYVLYDLRESKKKKENEARNLRDLNDFQSNFYTNVTHEFRTPLTVIIGMTDQIKEKSKGVSELIDHDLKMINRNAERLLTLVNQILSLSKLKQTKPQLNYIKANIIGYISQIIESLEPYAKANNLSLFFYTEDEDLIMDFDEQAISTILINLVSNAIKNTQANGQIFIHTKIDRNRNTSFILKVKDNGRGIPESKADQLFDRFAGSDGNQDDSIGLGLALTKQLVDVLKGEISVYSKVDQGSEFIIKLPITNSSILTNKRYSPLPNIGSFESKEVELPEYDPEKQTILVIEDNKDVASYIIRCLETKFSLFYAENGKAGIELAKKKRPDLVVSDIMMPIMDGLEVCEILKADESTKHIPIILLTAKANQNAKILGIAKGADAYLTKPFSKVEFLGRIAQLLDAKTQKVQSVKESDIASILRSKHKDPDIAFIKEAIAFIHKNLDNDIYGPPFLARNLGISESHLYKKLKSSTGKSTALFIRSIRLEKAKELLLTTELSISEVALKTGFKNISWFSRAFKKEFGFSPSEINQSL